MEIEEYNSLRATKDRIDALVTVLDQIAEVLESVLIDDLPDSVLAIRTHKLRQVRQARDLIRVMKLSG